ncbi:MAG TPA: N-acetylmuramoyl-L-alanine amidase [Chthoniobacterales bacterium]|jgi:N-acetylmuramoyl-L-alanine amidase
MKMFLCVLLLSAGINCGVAAEEWKIIRAEGRDYVSFANAAQFYRFTRFTQASRTVSLGDKHHGLRAQAGTSEFFINGLRFFCDFPLLVQGDDNFISAMDVSKIVEPVLRPNRIAGAGPVETVVLDPGHGGEDSGAAGPFGSEKAYALDVALAARAELQRAGFKVELTRTGDETVSLEQRVDFANRCSKAVFVSIHFNSASGGSGLESYVLAPSGVPSNASSEDQAASVESHAYPGNAHDTANIALAAAVQGAILSRVSVFDRGVRHARFHVLREIKIPGVLVEAGFLNDPVEGTRIATSAYRQHLGAAIAQAIATYDRAVNFKANSPAILAAAGSLPPHSQSITEPLGAAAPSPAKNSQTPSVAIQMSNK